MHRNDIGLLLSETSCLFRFRFRALYKEKKRKGHFVVLLVSLRDHVRLRMMENSPDEYTYFPPTRCPFFR
jgi:hypothetical protein